MRFHSQIVILTGLLLTVNTVVAQRLSRIEQKNASDAKPSFSKMAGNVFKNAPSYFVLEKPEQKQMWDEKITKYNADVTELLSGNYAVMLNNEKIMQAYYDGARIIAMDINRELGRGKEEFYKGDVYNAMKFYYTMRAWVTFCDAMGKFFPGDTAWVNAGTRVKAVMNEVGGEEGALAIIRKNEANIGKDVAMPAAVTTNTALEGQFRTAFNNTGWGETILKINLLSHDWGIDRNEATGRILGRTQMAAIAAKNSQGKCMLYHFSIIQEYDGSKYGSAKRLSHNARQIACENVK